MKNDAVLFWNEAALAANQRDHSKGAMAQEQPGPAFSTRALAIVHGAVYDAINSCYGTYAEYRYMVGGITDENSAVAGAAFTTLNGLYPSQQSVFKEVLKAFKGAFGFEPSSFGAGEQIGQKLLDARANDKSAFSRAPQGLVEQVPEALFPLASTACTVCQEGKPGQHRPFPAGQGCYAERWGEVDPFALPDLLQIASQPPHPLGSARYQQDFDEVKKVGQAPADNPNRTEEQRRTGLFWAYDGANEIGTPNRLYNQLARHIAADKGFDAYTNARFFLLLNLALGDAGIHSWRAKYTHCLWRPVVGIRETQGANPTWLPYGAPRSNTLDAGITPNFPAYPSGHATFGTAAFVVMQAFAGHDYVVRNFVSDEFNGKTFDRDSPSGRPSLNRTFTFNVATRQNLESRVFLGVHWRMDGDEGERTGRIIGERVCERIAKKVPSPSA